ncbi:MAG TPA: hypothetical protein VFK14_00195 [Solirubrobacterales bacterium]|nr:hypothetical protein [Solirubrobacterales bacterium]
MIFRPNPAFGKELEAELMRSRALWSSALHAADKAEALAHHAMPLAGGGRRIVVGEVEGDLAVINTNHGGHLEEWGLAHTPTYAPLRRGVRAAGLNLRES